MNTKTVNISFRKDLLKKIDKVAQEEMRTRSELIREAARMYIERKEKWKKIFDFGMQQANRLGLKEQDISEEIQKFRKKNRGNP
jgi:CopG family transcriptional regulator/antitoxin EndoAI